MAGGKQVRTPFPPWQTRKRDGYERSYIRLGSSQMMDTAMLSLSPGAFQTYCYMLSSAGGKKEFIYPQSQYLKICGSEAFERRKKELIQKGFIRISENGNNIVGKATLYRFANEWKEPLEITTLKRENAAPRAP